MYLGGINNKIRIIDIKMQQKRWQQNCGSIEELEQEHANQQCGKAKSNKD